MSALEIRPSAFVSLGAGNESRCEDVQWKMRVRIVITLWTGLSYGCWYKSLFEFR